MDHAFNIFLPMFGTVQYIFVWGWSLSAIYIRFGLNELAMAMLRYEKNWAKMCRELNFSMQNTVFCVSGLKAIALKVKHTC